MGANIIIHTPKTFDRILFGLNLDITGAGRRQSIPPPLLRTYCDGWLDYTTFISHLYRIRRRKEKKKTWIWNLLCVHCQYESSNTSPLERPRVFIPDWIIIFHSSYGPYAVAKKNGGKKRVITLFFTSSTRRILNVKRCGDRSNKHSRFHIYLRTLLRHICTWRRKKSPIRLSQHGLLLHFYHFRVQKRRLLI